MGKVIRVVRLPVADEHRCFELLLPRGAQIFKVDNVFTGSVDSDGEPIPVDGLCMLVDEGEDAVEMRRFEIAYLSSGIGDFNSTTDVLPGSSYRFISNIHGQGMLFEESAVCSEAEAPMEHVARVAI